MNIMYHAAYKCTYVMFSGSPVKTLYVFIIVKVKRIRNVEAL